MWPGLVATGWDLSVCHVYHEQCPPGYYGGCPDNIVEGSLPHRMCQAFLSAQSRPGVRDLARVQVARNAVVTMTSAGKNTRSLVVDGVVGGLHSAGVFRPLEL